VRQTGHVRKTRLDDVYKNMNTREHTGSKQVQGRKIKGTTGYLKLSRNWLLNHCTFSFGKLVKTKVTPRKKPLGNLV